MAVALVVYVIDQLTKIWAVSRLEGEPSIPLVGDIFSFTFVRNGGAAFGMGSGVTPVLTVVMITIAVGVLFLARGARDTGWLVALALLLGGAVGNITDRLLREPGVFRGRVVDFLHITNWPVFNVADIAITSAAVLIFWRSWRGVALDGSRPQPGDHRDD